MREAFFLVVNKRRIEVNRVIKELCSGDVWKRCVALEDDYEIQERHWRFLCSPGCPGTHSVDQAGCFL
ncbi:Membrane metallo-endopeptidase-like 1 [Apodemus speciosus]|uniref:Membrane metallo-endopeptidase-like 1 n=1 Tax=Apodemus speciosus TaxID=105296 RepID=A0ABQ0ES60_APOSI